MKNPQSSKKELHGVKEIARRAGVSIATVDRVLHNRVGVASSTKQKIEAIIKELDYKPNIIASRLATKKILNFIVLIPKKSEETDFWEGPFNGIKRAGKRVKEYGVSIAYYLFDLNNKNSFIEQAEKALIAQPDGIILAPSFIEEANDFVSKCKMLDIPFVLIDSNIPSQEGLCYIGPHLFKSGYLGGQLVNFTLKKDRCNLLLINITKDVDDYNYLVEIENGFRSYFKDNNLIHDIVKLDLKLSSSKSLKTDLDKIFNSTSAIDAVFVTNSRVHIIAKYLEQNDRKDVFVIGYDYINRNIEFLKKGFIDMLICHKPEEQGYKGVMTLYRYLVLTENPTQLHFMPIDIITKYNYIFY